MDKIILNLERGYSNDDLFCKTLILDILVVGVFTGRSNGLFTCCIASLIVFD
jgi:hypothetical protein